MNPMTVDLIKETIDALDTAAQDDEVRAIIITGAGRAFSAGGDVRRLADSATGGEKALPPTPFERRAWLRRTQRMILAIRQVEKPVIAAVNGVAAGGGFDIACASDIRIASDKARFSEVFARLRVGRLGGRDRGGQARRVPRPHPRRRRHVLPASHRRTREGA